MNSRMPQTERVMLKVTWTHAASTPKSCQDRKVAAIRDARSRRGLRVFLRLNGGQDTAGSSLRKGPAERAVASKIESKNWRQIGSRVWASVVVAGSLSLIAGCAAPPPRTAELPPPSPVADRPSPAPIPVPPDAEQQWQAAIRQANAAVQIAELAESNDDWSLVASRWQRAIAHLQAIGPEAERHAEATQKISEYQQNLRVAQQRANLPISTEGLLAIAPSESGTGTPVSAESEAEAADGAENTAEDSTTADNLEEGQQELPTPTELDGVSSPQEVLGAHLQSVGATLYTADPCPDCRRQEALLGDAALRRLTQVSCGPGGENPQPERCQAANVNRFPTWDINGTRHEGVRSLQELATLSNYLGDQAF